MTVPTPAQRALAEALADAAGAIIRPYFRRNVGVDDKPDRTPVTIADREAEAAMRRLIAARFPEHGIRGEEYGTERGDAEFLWVLDPIDGTKSFITGTHHFGTLIALCHHGRPILGVIDQPILRERWVGALGAATLLNGVPARTRACAALDRASMFATAPDMFCGPLEAPFARLREAVKLTRYSSDCYGYALLASGFVDLVVEAQLSLHDFAALVPVIAGAGGVLSDWEGRPLDAGSDGRVLAAGDPALHRAALAVLAG